MPHGQPRPRIAGPALRRPGEARQGQRRRGAGHRPAILGPGHPTLLVTDHGTATAEGSTTARGACWCMPSLLPTPCGPAVDQRHEAVRRSPRTRCSPHTLRETGVLIVASGNASTTGGPSTGPAPTPVSPLVDGYAMGSLSMACYTLGCHRVGTGRGGRRPGSAPGACDETNI